MLVSFGGQLVAVGRVVQRHHILRRYDYVLCSLEPAERSELHGAVSESWDDNEPG